MKVPLRTASRARHIVCPFCESGELGLPDALGTHPCECGHPEMRVLPDGVFHCPACGAEVLPIRKPRPGSARFAAGGPSR